MSNFSIHNERLYHNNTPITDRLVMNVYDDVVELVENAESYDRGLELNEIENLKEEITRLEENLGDEEVRIDTLKTIINNIANAVDDTIQDDFISVKDVKNKLKELLKSIKEVSNV